MTLPSGASRCTCDRKPGSASPSMRQGSASICAKARPSGLKARTSTTHRKWSRWASAPVTAAPASGSTKSGPSRRACSSPFSQNDNWCHMMPLCFGPMNRAGGPLFVFPHATAGPSARIRAVGRCDILRGMKTTKKKSAKASKPSRLTHGAPTVAAGTSRMRLRGTNPVRVKAILEGLDEMYPAATCELKHANPFQLLISTIMSAQCTDVRVNEVAKTLYVKYPTANHFAYANPSELEQEIRPTGFFRNKTKSIMGASKAIVENFGGEVPRTMEEMLTLPGAARKTANVVLG